MTVPKKMTIRCKACGNFGLMEKKDPPKKIEGRIVVKFTCLCDKPEVDWENPFPLN
tara:strand:+ start:249 stop:416 length:168 start_codon:yes stop_codon:yes gene_type:complete